MTEGTQYVLGGVLFIGCLASQVVDYILTEKALDRGFKEVGPINKWVVNKWGAKALPLATFLEAAFTVVMAGVSSSVAGAPGLIAYSCGGLAVSVYNNIRDIIKQS